MWLHPSTLALSLNLLHLSIPGRATDISNYLHPIVLEGVLTCPSQTINYITHSLPQQCLRTGWSSETAVTRDTSEGKIDEILQQTAESAAPSAVPSTGATVINGETGGIGSARDPVPGSSGIEEAISTTQEASSTPHEPRVTQVEERDTDILSDTPSFLSFEEWKTQMLAKAGQSPEDVRGMPIESQAHDKRRRSGGINNVLDCLGDDAEIELNFAGFVNDDTASSVLPRKPYATDQKSVPEDQKVEAPRKISTEAGTTSKERFNYASFDCAATTLKQNPECKGFNAVLSENKDSYLLNICSAKNKFFIVELCNDILIDTIVLANFEYFSSTFRTFRVSISDRYPVRLDKWREIGIYDARNVRGVQVFLVENGLIWARYLRIEFLTHFGSEYYCPVSLVRVHGKTMMDDWRNDVKAAKGDDDLEDTEDMLGAGEPTMITERQAKESSQENLEEALGNQKCPSDTVPDAEKTSDNMPAANLDPVFSEGISAAMSASMRSATRKTYGSPLLDQYKLMTDACSIDANQCPVDVAEGAEIVAEPYTPSKASSHPPNDSSTLAHPPSIISRLGKNTTGESQEITISTEHATSMISVSDASNMSTTLTTVTTKSSTQQAVVPSKTIQQPTPPTPSTQESFFKSLHKRLQHLESNSTLSLQYIEEQSRILREAFSKGQKQQLGKTTVFLESVNVTVLGELQNFRLQYDQIWQSTVLELSAQREQSQREIVALTTRLGILADEILFQRRMVILQFALILLCLGLVLFSRSPTATVLDLPSTMQSVVSKPSKVSHYLHLDSPPASPSRPPTSYSFFSSGASPFPGLSSESTIYDEVTDAAEIAYAPPMPKSECSDDEGDDQTASRASPESDMAMRRVNRTPSNMALPDSAHIQEAIAEQATPLVEAASAISDVVSIFASARSGVWSGFSKAFRDYLTEYQQEDV